MGLPRAVQKTLWPLIVAAFIAWVVELFGLLSLHRACTDHHDQVWYAYAELPHVANCGKIFRYLWWIVWLEVPIGLFILAALIGWLGTSYNVLARYRTAIVALLAVETALHMWGANVALNLTDSDATHFLSKSEITRARVALVGFCLQSIVSILTIIILGDDGEEAAWGTEPGLGTARDPLLSEGPEPTLIEEPGAEGSVPIAVDYTGRPSDVVRIRKEAIVILQE